MRRVSFVAVNVLAVPEGGGDVLEQRFARRQGSVERADGFEDFQLLRPVEGTEDYVVYTRWRSREDFQRWREAQTYEGGHARASGRDEGEGRAATGSTVWAFEVAQRALPAGGPSDDDDADEAPPGRSGPAWSRGLSAPVTGGRQVARQAARLAGGALGRVRG